MANLISMRWEGLDAAKAMVDSKKARRGYLSGTKKVGEAVKSLSSKTIRETYNMKKGDVDKAFKVEIHHNVIIVCKGRPINLTAFNARQFGSRGGKRVTTKRVGDSIQSRTRGKSGAFGGIAATIRKDKTTLLPSAFIAKVAAGRKGAFNIGVFQRTNHAMKTSYKNPYQRKTSRPYVKVARAQEAYRAAIVNKAMVTVPTLFNSPRVMDNIRKYINTDGIKTVMGEIRWAMTGKR
ncbi:MAG TPA: hypothetical protein DCS42_15525 [Nitrospiraceae bacterium]|nr:hypothetical protein [Nitrospiraceae bacterium]